MIRFCEGERIRVNGKACIIKRLVTFDVIEVQDAETGARKTVSRQDIGPSLPESVQERITVTYSALTDEQVRIRDLRLKIIEPTHGRISSKGLMEECASKAVEAGLLKKGHISTIYDWRRRFAMSNSKNALAPPFCPTGGRGGHRLDLEVDDLLMAVVDGSFLSSQKKSPTAVFTDVLVAFRKENSRRAKAGDTVLATPCKDTVFARIKAINPKVALEKRYGPKAAKERFGIMKGHLIRGFWPWELGQMDHKLLRTVVIDGVTGEPIGNPWLTVIIDTNSRIPAGFVVSLAKPSATNVGLCLAMSMLQKQFWLSKWGIDQEDFPVFGRWGTVQVDNGLENEARGIIEGCKNRGIELEFRPLRNPQSGGYIETFFRTLDIEMKKLPGYMSKNRRDRENYNAKDKAALTLQQLTEVIAVFIISIYCRREHSGLKDSPLNVYKHNLMASGIGIPEVLVGEEVRNLILDFMPYEERTIQEYGIEIFNMHYRCENLEEYRIQSASGEGPDKKFKIKVDPRDISSVFLCDAQKHKYVQVPNASPEFGPISLEEHYYLKRILRRNGFKSDPETIMKAHEHLADLIAGTVKEKKRLLREQKRAASRGRDLGEQPKTSEEPKHIHSRKKTLWIPKKFEIELDD